jgi:hypothetical protein
VLDRTEGKPPASMELTGAHGRDLIPEEREPRVKNLTKMLLLCAKHEGWTPPPGWTPSSMDDEK